MRPVSLVRSGLDRPVVRALPVLAFALGGWFAWSPGTSFGLGGALGGWRYASAHLLEAGLIPVSMASALVASGLREQRVDDAMRTAGTARSRLVADVVIAGCMVALIVMAAYVAGCGAGGLARAALNGGSWWFGPGSPGPTWRLVALDVRLSLAVVLAGGLGALGGWLARRDDLAVVMVLGSTIPYLEQSAALVGRVPAVVEVLARSPVGALRGVALANAGLAAPGFERPASVAVSAAVMAAWIVVAAMVALPRDRSRDHATPSGRPGRRGRSRSRGISVSADWPRPAAVAVMSGLVAVTLVFGALVPPAVAGGLPWRWQRSWRDAHRNGWASDQVVDRLLADLRTSGTAPAELVTRADAVTAVVVDAVRRASRVERQPVSSMRSPEQVGVRLDFDQPVASGVSEFTAYGLRMALVAGPDGHWRVDRIEGPAAVRGQPRSAGA